MDIAKETTGGEKKTGLGFWFYPLVAVIVLGAWYLYKTLSGSDDVDAKMKKVREAKAQKAALQNLTDNVSEN
jgi:hypothetical protein